MLVKITAFRQGDFWHQPVYAGQVLELPDETASYLLGVGAAELAGEAGEPAELAGAPIPKKAKAK